VAEFKNLGPFCETAEMFWRTNLPPDGERVILVEAMHQDLRVTLRNLTVANALRRIEPARVVVYTGADEDWQRVAFSTFDHEVLERLSRAYLADDVIDVHRLADDLIGPEPPESFIVGGRTIRSSDLRTGIDPDAFEQVVHATAARVYLAPRIDPAERTSDRYQYIRARSDMLSKIYDAMLAEFDVIALITSHVDYNHWGLAVESAQRFGIPVVHVQCTGTLKAYTSFPENRRGGLTFRGELTKQIGEYFDKYIWTRREDLADAAELTFWRNKGTHGRPSWWRGGGHVSSIQLRTAPEREAIRPHAMDRVGLDRSRPVVAVFNHAISDALNTNKEIFDDLADWFEQTVAFAADRADVNWLFVDHPSQALYDGTDFFDGVAAKYAGQPHMSFVQSMDLSKNLLWSLVDLGITVRGSISTELPAFGVPAVQAGWSEWSELGISTIASDTADYWRIVRESLDALTSGRALITEDQIAKARLWMWFYRSLADVPSVFVQTWELGETDEWLDALRVSMRFVETDADPVFESVRRMWQRKEPFLTRLDITCLAAADLAHLPRDATIVADGPAGRPGPRMLTIHDRPVPPLPVPGSLDRGDDAAFLVVDGIAKGFAVPGRFIRTSALIGLKVEPGTGSGPVRVRARLGVDDLSLTWWEERVPASVQPRTPAAPRLLLVRSQAATRTAVLLEKPERGAATADAAFELERAELDADGLLVIEVLSLRDGLPQWAVDALAPAASIGVPLDRVDLIEDADDAVGGASGLTRDGLFIVDPDHIARGWALYARPVEPAVAPSPVPAAKPPGLRHRIRVRSRSETPLLPASPPRGAFRDRIVRLGQDGLLQAQAVGLLTGAQSAFSFRVEAAAGGQDDTAVELIPDRSLTELSLVKLDTPDPHSGAVEWRLIRHAAPADTVPAPTDYRENRLV
jgi:hypothetical protein